MRASVARRTAVMTMAILAWLSSARADTVQIGKLPYSNVRVADCSNGNIVFLVGANPVSKGLTDVTLIQIEGKEAFNQAEKQRAGDPAKAAALYDNAMRSAWNQWEKKLITYRRLDCLGRAGLTGRWAHEWALLLLETGEPAATRLSPAKIGNEAEVKAATKTLREAMQRANDSTVRAAMAAVLEQLKQGPSEPGQSTRPSEPLTEPVKPETPQDGPNIVAQSAGELRTFETKVSRGQGADIVDDIDRYIKTAPVDDLPRGLFLAGAARLQAAEKTGNRRLLAEAALMFMKVTIFFPGSPDAAQALYRAGEASQALGETKAALEAYRILTVRYNQSDYAKRAADKIKALEAEAERQSSVKS